MVAEISGQLISIAFILVLIVFLLTRCTVFLGDIADHCKWCEKQDKEQND